MEKMTSSVKQVPAQLLRARTGNTLEAERENFERGQNVSINKAINAQEVAVKEKHARTCILGTHHEKGAQTFWSVVNRLPLSSNAVLCWKFCHVFHKLLRDGHPTVLQDSIRYKNELSDMSRMWGHLSEGYGKLSCTYLKLLITKMEFHSKNPRFPGNLQMTDRQLEETGENDVNNFFQLTVEMFDYLECELNLFQAVFSSLDMSRSVSVTAAGQCRLAPLIQVILDSSHLYDYTVKLLFKLHSCLPADTLQGHRDRFHEQFKKLKELFYISSNLQYFKRLIQIPQLPENPPNFLRASALSEHVSPVVVIPVESTSPDSEPVVETDELVEMDPSSQQNLFENKFDDLFGRTGSTDPFNFNNQNGMSKDERDKLIDQLYKEIAALKDELASFKAESKRLILQLRGRINELEAELAEQQHLKQQALDENEFVKAELEEVKKKQDVTEKAQRSLTEIERKAQANEQRYTKLKEKYTELVQNHADLLRKNAEVMKQMTLFRQTQEDMEQMKKELEETVQQLKDSMEQKEQEQTHKLDALQEELQSRNAEVLSLKSTHEDSKQTSTVMVSTIESLASEKTALSQAVDEKESTLTLLRGELEQAKEALTAEKDSTNRTVEGLQNQLNEKESHEQALEKQLLDEQFALLRSAVEEAEGIIQDALNRLEDPLHFGCTSSADYLITRAQATQDSLSRLQNGHTKYLADKKDASSLLQSVTLFTHLMSDTIVQGSATSHMVPMEQADNLLDACKRCGSDVLSYFSNLKDSTTLSIADCTKVRESLNQINAIAEELRPKGRDIKQKELGDLVEQEMCSTSAAVEAATARIEEMLNKSRAGDTGAKLEVNARILESCTGLMHTIKVLVLSSKDLQRDIVESGRGAASQKEFYAKNSRWTEGLISASKAVGWGATVLVDAADLVVQGKGKFEELMVCSHEIAASTAQLVAASKVKADKDNCNLGRLREASKGVNEATAKVVASTKSGKFQIEEKDTMDFSSMTLTQIKRQEMDSQVHVLELESQLQKERERLGGLRKKHYELAGVSEGWDEDTK
ncbi:huntingtin-interacting protein 1 isoform X2 [Amblyraja radiata]|uniref:huntingtin-interacting protein 1 isoform X2 n=1 Tax=Amblyraja radiata TaxID=386614 RepID=UPI001402A771|nr:huntingtin-interacting protein 1 isoform X2 [Amblyraja radiata]